MLLDRPLRQPEDLLVALPRSALVRFHEEEKIAPLVTLAVQHHGDTATALIEGDDIHPFQLFQHLVRRWRLVFAQAEDMSACCWPVVLGAEHQPRLTPSDNLQAVEEAVVLGWL